MNAVIADDEMTERKNEMENMSRYINEKEYQRICSTLIQSVKTSSADELLSKRHILIIGANRAAFPNGVRLLKSGLHGNRVTIVAQHAMLDVFKAEELDGMEVVEWQGNYSLSILECIAYRDIDGMLFFPVQEIDLYSLNMLRIAASLSENENFHLYTYIEGMMYQYDHPEDFYSALVLYKDINEYIGSERSCRV